MTIRGERICGRGSGVLLLAVTRAALVPVHPGCTFLVMPGLDPGIHAGPGAVLPFARIDARIKSGHDGSGAEGGEACRGPHRIDVGLA